MAPPPSPNLPLSERLLTLAKTLQCMLLPPTSFPSRLIQDPVVLCLGTGKPVYIQIFHPIQASSACETGFCADDLFF